MKELEYSQHYTLIFRRRRTAYSVICCGTLSNFELIQAFMYVLVTCKKEEDPIKIKALECSQYYTIIAYGDFSRCSRAANSAVHCRIWSNFKLVRDFIIVPVTCKYEEDPIKNEGARVYINFPDAQGQITQELVVATDRNLNSSKLSCMPLSPARMKKIE